MCIGESYLPGPHHGLDTSRVGFETVASAHGASCGPLDPEYKCWRNHLVKKVGGRWWSFFNESYCAGDSPLGTGGCAWRVTGPAHAVNNTCLLDHVYAAVEAFPPTRPCYAACAGWPARNVSDPCVSV